MSGAPDAAVIPQLMRKGHKIRAMLDDNIDNARAEIFFALEYLLKDLEPPEADQDDCGGGEP